MLIINANNALNLNNKIRFSLCKLLLNDNKLLHQHFHFYNTLNMTYKQK
jgi:hypothetical protein